MHNSNFLAKKGRGTVFAVVDKGSFFGSDKTEYKKLEIYITYT